MTPSRPVIAAPISAVTASEILTPEVVTLVEQRIVATTSLTTWLIASTSAGPITPFQYVRMAVGVVAYLLTEAITAALQETAALRTKVIDCKVSDAGTFTQASAYLSSVKTARKTITEKFDPLVKFLREPLDGVYARRKQLDDEWVAHEASLKRELKAYSEKEAARVARETAERNRRIAEEARVEAERVATEQARLAVEEAARIEAQRLEQARREQAITYWRQQETACMEVGDLAGYAAAVDNIRLLGELPIQPPVSLPAAPPPPPVLMTYTTSDALPVAARISAVGSSSRFHLVARITDMKAFMVSAIQVEQDGLLGLVAPDEKALRAWCEMYEAWLTDKMATDGVIEMVVVPGLSVKKEAIISGRT